MSLPLVKLWSLDLIRGFVAVGRRMSITLAAEELCVTQSAVSRQVRALEEMLGVQLLKRGHRSIAFTPEGEKFFRAANVAIQQLQDISGALMAATDRRPVTITCSIGIASLWLLPRLREFQREHPDVDVRIAASDRIEDLRGDSIDLAIRYTAANAAQADAIRLFDESVAPVAHPSLGISKLGDADDVRGQYLLEFDGPNFPWLHWEDWIASQGWQDVRPKGMLHFNHYDQVINAAATGQGIALGRVKLLAPLLADGRLRTLQHAKSGPPTTYAYWLINAKPDPREQVSTVASWIQEQAATTLREPGQTREKRKRSPRRGKS